MGKTIPSFRIVLEMEKAEWKPFRNALDKSERKEFDEIVANLAFIVPTETRPKRDDQGVALYVSIKEFSS
jgi:hypothetical protein